MESCGRGFARKMNDVRQDVRVRELFSGREYQSLALPDQEHRTKDSTSGSLAESIFFPGILSVTNKRFPLDHSGINYSHFST